jgi:hypothetical protein
LGAALALGDFWPERSGVLGGFGVEPDGLLDAPLDLWVRPAKDVEGVSQPIDLKPVVLAILPHLQITVPATEKAKAKAV